MTTNFYTYMTTDCQRYYIGSRVCHCDIEADDYMGSHRDTSYKPISKTILGVHETWTEARLAEAYWHNLFKVYTNPLFANQANAAWFVKDEDNLEPRDLTGKNNHFYGRTHSEETKALISRGHKGKKLSDETKEKIRQANLGKTLSKEHREKIAKSNSGYNHTASAKQKMSDAKRDKTIYSWKHKDGRSMYASHKELYTTFNLSKSSLREVINGKRKTCGGWSICLD